ncbi:unnamed protein product [Phytophthora fragariaefolia]|uniref:Unnamed protein product n=1 Tax=Phytophthora fragariaefolia TaxID=1490495 RepID=A0A9W6XWL7_9STRA|nr:unnamed protein product [Phytophthora fragariaefolia]
MDQINATFGPKLSKSHALRYFTSKKGSWIMWNHHLLYQMTVSEAVGGANDLVLENIDKYANPREGLQTALLTRYNPHRTDDPRQAAELAHFAQLADPGSTKDTSKVAVAAVSSTGTWNGTRQRGALLRVAKAVNASSVVGQAT